MILNEFRKTLELPKCPKYFSMHLQILQDLFKVLNHFLECLQAVKRPPREKKGKNVLSHLKKGKKNSCAPPGDRTRTTGVAVHYAYP